MASSTTIFKNEVLDYHSKIDPSKVHSIISQHMLADGFDIVLDLKNSKDSIIVDKRNGDEYLDMFTFFASNPVGMNHPKMTTPEVLKEFAFAAVHKPSNSDVYTTLMADFVETFARVAKPDYMKYMFFVSGGALAVENALKVAFDWKVQKNFEKGYKDEKGHKVIHFRKAFHGRSGYTMSLTNTDPTKVKYFPKFDWPRITNPIITFPLENNIDEIKKTEEQAIGEITTAIQNNPDDIASIIIEPVQGEGGDNFFRKEFFEKLRQIADENEILLIFDEVQTGFGLTGKFWAHEYYVKPDILAFGKKAQVCGIMSTDRVDDVEKNCFHESSRINSTWGANLTDMVRSKNILHIMEEDNLVENARVQGEYLLKGLYDIQNEFPQLVKNTRGLGLMCSFNFPNPDKRKAFLDEAAKQKIIILPCGETALRFRPRLNVEKDDIDKALKIIRNILTLMLSKN